MKCSWRPSLILWILVVVVTTTLPWSGLQGLQGHAHRGNVRWIPCYPAVLSLRSVRDIVVNLSLFVPFGYLYVRSQITMPRTMFLRITLLAVLLSIGVELVQVFSHARIPS